MKKKQFSLEQEIDKIMRRYVMDPYGKNAYIKNVSKAIVKVIKERAVSTYNNTSGKMEEHYILGEEK
jgi:hypothetical protein